MAIPSSIFIAFWRITFSFKCLLFFFCIFFFSLYFCPHYSTVVYCVLCPSRLHCHCVYYSGCKDVCPGQTDIQNPTRRSGYPCCCVLLVLLCSLQCMQHNEMAGHYKLVAMVVLLAVKYCDQCSWDSTISATTEVGQML